MKNPGIVSDNPFKMPKVGRDSIDKNKSTAPFKGGKKVCHRVSRDDIKGRNNKGNLGKLKGSL